MQLVSNIRSIRVLAAASLVVLGACDPAKHVANNGPNSAAGTYNLALVSQGSTDCQVSAGACTIQNTGASVVRVQTGTLNLASNNTFTLNINGTVDGAARNVGTVAGTWAATSSGISLTAPGVPIPIVATWTTNVGQQLLFAAPGSLFASSQAAVTVLFNKSSAQ